MFPMLWKYRRAMLSTLTSVYFIMSWMILKNNNFGDQNMTARRTDGSNPVVVTLKDLKTQTDKVNGEIPIKKPTQLLARNTFNMSIEPNVPIGADNTTYKDKYFIYRCDESTLSLCGGWLNRIKGAALGYLIANLTGRAFKMENKMRSCDFHRYLVPNHVDWYLPVSFHERVTHSNDIFILRKIDDRGYLSNANHDFSSNVPTKTQFVYFKANIEYFMKFKKLKRYQKQLSWMQDLTYTQIVNTLYRRLFRPSPYLQNKTDIFLKSNLKPHEKLVCAQLRTGPNPSNPQDVQAYKVTKDGLDNTWKFFQEMTKLNDSKIFFMSDSEDIIRRAKGMSFGDKVFSSPGKMVHIDRSRGVSPELKCGGLEKIIFDHYVLLHCDSLLVSRSSIGMHAAAVRDTDDGLYCLHDSGHLGPCKRSELVEIFDYAPLI